MFELILCRETHVRMQAYMDAADADVSCGYLWTWMLSKKSSKFPPVIVWMKTKAHFTPHPSASTETHISGGRIGHSRRICAAFTADQARDVTRTFL